MHRAIVYLQARLKHFREPCMVQQCKLPCRDYETLYLGNKTSETRRHGLSQFRLIRDDRALKDNI
jgi:hypothetical protein